jgi:CTP:molybdopterin cytidylyltransferase MocA
MAEWRGRPLVWSAAAQAQASGLAPVWVVAGAVDLAGSLPEGVIVLANPRWGEGQATSLQVAVAAARSAGLDALVVGLGDQPLVTAEAWAAVGGAAAPIAVATYDGRRRNPVRLAAAVWDLLPAVGDQGARVLIQERPDLVQEVPCQGDPADIDTREDLRTWS